jgi:hypothetical protein
VVLAIVSVVPAARALAPKSTVQVNAWIGAGESTPLPGCASTGSNTLGMQELLQDCSVPGAGTARISNRALTVAPSVFDPQDPLSYRLARLGARSSLELEVHAYHGTNRSFQLPTFAVTAQASTSFRDYLMLGALRPASLQLDFHLSGDLRIDPALSGTLNPFQLDAIYVVAAGSGYQASDGAFVASSPNAGGWAQVNRQLKLFGGTPTVLPLVESNPATAFTLTETSNALGGTDVRVVLGADFFSNPANDLVALELGLSSSVHGPAWTFKDMAYGEVLTGKGITADFGSTFEMVGLQAFDAAGQDITASAVLGFQSMQPVPEPRAWLLLAAGLVGVALRCRRQASEVSASA